MLLYYASVDRFADFNKGDLKDYPQFVRIISEFRKHYGLDRFSLRQVDVFLWLAGKECFPRMYGKRKKASRTPSI